MQRWIPTLAALFAVGCASPVAGPQVIAHRGASGLAPEHTLAAFDLAIELGADWIEQDLHLTRDGVPVVVHDDTLDRTARGPADACTGPVRGAVPLFGTVMSPVPNCPAATARCFGRGC